MRLINLIILASLLVVLAGCGTPEERAADHLESAREAFAEGDLINAKLDVQNTLQIEPKNPQARYLLALIDEEEGDGRRMLQNLLIAVDADPEGDDVELVGARIKLGTLYMLARAFELAAEQSEVAMKLAPENPGAYLLHARLMLVRGQTELGLEALDVALSLDEGFADAIGMKALIYQDDDPDRSLAILDEAINRLPREDTLELREHKLYILNRHGRTDDLEASLLTMIGESHEEDLNYRTRLAELYRNKGEYDAAEKMLRDIAAEASGDAEARIDVVEFLAETKSMKAASEALQGFLDEDPDNMGLKVTLGDLYLLDNRRDKALEVYRQVAEQDPMSADGMLARVKLAADRIEKGDLAAGAEMIDAILLDDPGFPQALLLRSSLRFNDQLYGDAIADLRVMLRKEPKNENGLLLMGRIEAAAGNVILSRDAYQRLLNVNPNNEAATREIVELMISEGEFDEALAMLDKLTRNSLRNTTAVGLSVDLPVMQDDWETAEAVARQFADGPDPFGAGAFKLGQVLEARERYAEAEVAFRKALVKSPSNLKALQGLARTLKASGKQDELVSMLREMSAERPESITEKLMLAGLLAEQGKSDQSKQLFETLITDHPQLSTAYIGLTSLYPDDDVQRISIYQRGMSAIPGNLAIGKLLAEDLAEQQRYAEVIELYESLLAANPEAWEIANNLAATLADQRYEDAASIKRAVELAEQLSNRDEPQVMDTVGWVYYRNSDSDRAINYLERAVAALPDIPVLRYHLGMAYHAAGNRFGAQQELEKALEPGAENFAGSDEAREILATLN